MFRKLLANLKVFFDLTPCYKEGLGYTCHHRVYKGRRECDGEKV